MSLVEAFHAAFYSFPHRPIAEHCIGSPVLPAGVFHGPDDSVSAPPSSGRGNYLPTQSQASYHSASSSPSARRPSSGFDGVNEEADVRANATVVDGHADVRASAVMTEDNDDQCR